MRTILFFQRGTPDIINLILLLIGILLCLLALNSLYEWIKSKPWKNVKTPDKNIAEQNEETQNNDDLKTHKSNDYTNNKTLHAAIPN